MCDVVFPSKQASQVDGFLDRHQIAVVSAVELNSAGAKFPVVMSFVTPLVEYFYSLITTNCREREQKDLSSISLMRRYLNCCSNGFPISGFPDEEGVTTSPVFDATSRTICAPIFSVASFSSDFFRYCHAVFHGSGCRILIENIT